MSLIQDLGELVALFSAQLKGQANLCSFMTKCKCDAPMDVSYTNLGFSHQLVNGIEYATVQEKVIAHFAETAEPGLVKVQKYVEALELGKQNWSALQESSSHHM